MSIDNNNITPSARKLDPQEFPNPPRDKKLPITLPNVEHMLDGLGFEVCFNVITKEVIGRKDGKPCAMIDIISAACEYSLASGWFGSFLNEIAQRNPLNPIKDWIRSCPWDGVDRLPAIYATITPVDDYPIELRDILLHRWLLSATAAAMLEGRRFHARGVLTLQGGQGIGKTTWVSHLMPPGELRNEVIKRDHLLDASNKDSIIGAIKHWITEIGELDSSFRKDVGRIKGFLTNDCDRLRPPYGRTEVKYDRRTVFAATVNDQKFLVDDSGNGRWWVIAADAIDYQHTVPMQQVFAQLNEELRAGAQWWLTAEEDQMLGIYNLRHRAVSAIAERIREFVDLDAIGTEKGKYMTAIEVLSEIGVGSPSNNQCRECGAVLRELFGQPKRVQGRDKWRVPKVAVYGTKPDRKSASGSTIEDEIF
ncbi:MAG: hypothetical protein GXC70_00890 [Sphingomonadaceae bacterium]|nr:hypothetical protein [Sphingomonadaceae bacterium]